MTTVSAVVRRGDSILVVRNASPEHPQGRWYLPGGVVETGESLHEALRRELAEETSLQIGPASWLAWVCAARWGGDQPGESFSFVFEVPDPGGDLECADPDGIVCEAEFVAVDEALTRFGAVTWARMREPAVAYLRGDAAPGSVYCYVVGPSGDADFLVDVVPLRNNVAPPRE